jgi:pentatricopeptide repeat protein
MLNEDPYPPISDYGYIADCHSSALVSRSGSIDWCCMPRVDSRSCFGRILGWGQGGYCQIVPSVPYKTSRRYLTDTLGNDGLEGNEGAFLACSFWLVECLARQGRPKEAHKVFKRALSTGNDLGLLSEEYDVQSKDMLGNFPQGLTHLSLIGAVVALGDRDVPRSSQVGETW